MLLLRINLEGLIHSKWDLLNISLLNNTPLFNISYSDFLWKQLKFKFLFWNIYLKDVVNPLMAKYWYFQCTGICIFPLKNNITQWISIEFIIIMYYVNVILLENLKKRSKNFGPMSIPWAINPPQLIFKMFFGKPAQERHGKKNWIFYFRILFGYKYLINFTIKTCSELKESMPQCSLQCYIISEYKIFFNTTK